MRPKESGLALGLHICNWILPKTQPGLQLPKDLMETQSCHLVSVESPLAQPAQGHYGNKGGWGRARTDQGKAWVPLHGARGHFGFLPLMSAFGEGSREGCWPSRAHHLTLRPGLPSFPSRPSRPAGPWGQKSSSSTDCTGLPLNVTPHPAPAPALHTHTHACIHTPA